jgi:hypothetical protein
MNDKTPRSLKLQGTTVEIDGDKWLVILMPVPRAYLPLTRPGSPPVDSEVFWQFVCSQPVAIATRGVQGDYLFSVPEALAKRMRSKIARDFVWEKIVFPPF